MHPASANARPPRTRPRLGNPLLSVIFPFPDIGLLGFTGSRLPPIQAAQELRSATQRHAGPCILAVGTVPIRASAVFPSRCRLKTQFAPRGLPRLAGRLMVAAPPLSWEKTKRGANHAHSAGVSVRPRRHAGRQRLSP